MSPAATLLMIKVSVNAPDICLTFQRLTANYAGEVSPQRHLNAGLRRSGQSRWPGFCAVAGNRTINSKNYEPVQAKKCDCSASRGRVRSEPQTRIGSDKPDRARRWRNHWHGHFRTHGHRRGPKRGTG